MPTKQKTSRKRSVRSASTSRLQSNVSFSSRQLVLIGSLFAIIGVVVIWKSFAASVSGVSWNNYFTQLNSWNDLQTTSSNTVSYVPGCVWNDMDDITDVASGSLAAGASTNHSMCLVADYGLDGFFPHMILYKLPYNAKLSLSLSNDAGNILSNPAVVSVGKQKYYEFCVGDPVALSKWSQPESVWPTISVPDTNGGVGQLVHYTLSAKNMGSGSIKFTGFMEIGPDNRGNTTNFRSLSDVACPTS